MLDSYPQGPEEVPEKLTQPAASYRLHAWSALLGLLGFVGLYVALLLWFAWRAWSMAASALRGGDHTLIAILASSAFAFLTLVMVSGLFVGRATSDPSRVELSEAQQPELFAFLNRLAAEVGAPRPHRVYLSPRVNASVFYDLRLGNLLRPAKKNLEIGLGLVNLLDLGEFKAVIAHEFGHFAQGSMRVGRWVYVAQRIVGRVVAERGALDKFLDGASRIDFRVAWIAWLLRLVVWSLRSLVDSFFRVVLLADRALSRQMEYQADLVSVSACGSDAIVSALHRLGAADESWQRALAFAEKEHQEGRPVADLYALQSRLVEHLRRALADDAFGASPQPTHQASQDARVFADELACPPAMWASHPANGDREQNAKRRYVFAPRDERSAWCLFRNPQELRQQVTQRFIRSMVSEDYQPAPLTDSLAKLDESFALRQLEPRYRGSYATHSPVRLVRSAAELHDPPRPWSREELLQQLQTTYPQELREKLEALRSLREEHAALEALREGVATAPNGVIRHRGRVLRRRQLPGALQRVDAELELLVKELRQRDRRCRSLHRDAGALLGHGWDDYLIGLAKLWHYAEHVEADLRDALGQLANVVSVVTADGRVSDAERRRVIAVALSVYQSLAEIHRQREAVTLTPQLLSKLSLTSWAWAFAPVFELPAPTVMNLGDWLEAANRLGREMAGKLSDLGLEALDALLVAEDHVAERLRDGAEPGVAPAAPTVPARYACLVPGSERPRQRRLDTWDRFVLADGTVPSLARFAVAATILLSVTGFARLADRTELDIVNGLARGVVVNVNGTDWSLEPGGNARVPLHTDRVRITTRTLDGQRIEDFSESIPLSAQAAVYDVASAASLIEWTAIYGNVTRPPDRQLGARRWMPTDANFRFTEPPHSVEGSGSGSTRSVLTALSTPRAASRVTATSERASMILAHARWDDTTSSDFGEWMGMAMEGPEGRAVLAARLQQAPRDPYLLRLEQDLATPQEHALVCARHDTLAAAAPQDADLRYLQIRCMASGPAQDRAFLEAHARFPDNGWLTRASAYAELSANHLPETLELLALARRQLPSLSEDMIFDEARVRRFQATGDAQLRTLTRLSEALARTLALEAGELTAEDPPAMRAFYLLHQGKLEQAVTTAEGIPELGDRVLRLAAASTGASSELVQRALSLPMDRGLDSITLWPALALAVREGRDTEALLSTLPSRMAEEGRQAVRWLRSVAPLLRDLDGQVVTSATLERLEELDVYVRDKSPVMRGALRAMSLVAYGKLTPEPWRREVGLLFAVESPWFG